MAENDSSKIVVTAWNNGAHHSGGAGYGVKISVEDRNQCFDRSWQEIELLLDGETKPVKINVNKESFWGRTCRELISAEIGRWLMKQGLAPWKKGEPPKLDLEYLGENKFRLKY